MDNEVFKIYKETTHKRWGHRIYEVSNLGRVKINGEIVEPHINNSYLCIGSFSIHRAVAELFIPNPENKPFIDHINTNPLDNRAENLRWVTAKENSNNPLTIKHQSEAKLGKVLTEETRRKISEIQKGKPGHFKGKTLSEEHKRKLIEANKGKHRSEETKLKMSKARKGRILTEEHKAKIGAARKGKPSTFKGKHHSEEAKQKLSESHKGVFKGRHWKLVDGKRIWYD